MRQRSNMSLSPQSLDGKHWKTSPSICCHTRIRSQWTATCTRYVG
jgi:hypothetical protein